MSRSPTKTLTALVVYVHHYLRPDGVSVDQDPISTNRARLAASQLGGLLETYSKGMGTLAVTVRGYKRTRVGPEYYRATTSGGYVIDARKIRTLMKADAYDIVVVMTDPDATYGTDWTGLATGDSLWVRIQPTITARIAMHEIGHVLEHRVKAAGGTAWNDCGGGRGHAIHCYASYGHEYNSPEWFEAFFSGLPDGTAMTPDAWDLI